MKILITQETDWLIRNPAQQHHLAEKLSLRGHEIRVIDYPILWNVNGREKGFYYKRQIFNNVSKIHADARIMVIRPSFIKIPWLDYASLIFFHKREIDKQIRKFAPDVVIGFDILNAYLAMKASKKNEIPFVHYWIDVNHRLIPFKPFQPIGKLVEGITSRAADQILTINDKLSDYVIKQGVASERIRVVSAGINVRQFDSSVDNTDIRERYGLLKEDVVLFFMGWLYDFSGMKEVAIELSKIKDDKPNIKLLIVGDGDAFKDLQKIRKEYQMDDQLILTGRQPYKTIPEFISVADVCLLPAYPNEKIMRDIVPIKLYEYMAMKKPVVTTKLPGVMKEFGRDHGVIYVDSPEDVFRKAIELNEDGSIVRLGLKARKYVEKYDWNDITDEFEGILNELVYGKNY